MIIDTLKNADRYHVVHPLFKKAFDYIAQIDFHNTKIGTFEIEGEMIRAIFSERMGMTAAGSTAEFECHNKHIDIQLCIQGVEQFGWKPRETCVKDNGGYNAEKDVQLYSDRPDMYFQLLNGQFVILFPEDVHAPMIGDQKIKKLVIKVRI